MRFSLSGLVEIVAGLGGGPEGGSRIFHEGSARLLGEGVKLFLEGFLASRWDYFRGAEFFSWELQFFLGDFFLCRHGSVFFC